MDWTDSMERSLSMDEFNLDPKKLNLIKIKVIQLERDNLIKKKPNDEIVSDIRKYVKKVVDSKW